MLHRVLFATLFLPLTALGGTRACVAKINISERDTPRSAQALALEDDHGSRAVLVSLDVPGLPLDFVEWVAAQVQKEYDLDRARLTLSCSRPCSGVLEAGSERARLAGQVVTLVGAALGGLRPARITFEPGVPALHIQDQAGGVRSFVIGDHGRPDAPEAKLSGRLRSVFQVVELPQPPSARGLMRKPAFPVQVVRFDKGFTLIALGCEVTNDFVAWALREFPRESLMVVGYANGTPDVAVGQAEERIKDAVRGVMKRVLH